MIPKNKTYASLLHPHWLKFDKFQFIIQISHILRNKKIIMKIKTHQKNYFNQNLKK